MIDFFSSDRLIEPKRGDLLISEPYLPDPNFERTVILVCEHDDNGTIGFVLNKPGHIGLSDVMDDVTNDDAKVFIGGPVQQDTLHFLHRSDQLKHESNEVIDGLFWGGDYEKANSLINTYQLQAEEIKFFMGYSGWSEGQLLDEMKQKSWIVFQKPSLEMIFNTPPEQLWKVVLREMGGKFKLISNYPEDPRLN